MPFFGRNKKDSKQQQHPVVTAKKKEPYRHVPKHAGIDARTYTAAEGDRAAQQKRIMQASQSRLNSMNSNYSIKSNFNDVPMNSQSRPTAFPDHSWPRPSSGGVSGKDRHAAQPSSPLALARPARSDYVKSRNPSLVSGSTLATKSDRQSTFAALKQSHPGWTDSSDAGYGSTAPPSKSTSKAPSETSEPSGESRRSRDVRFAPTETSTLDFLPKLDFKPEVARKPASSEPPASTPAAKPVSSAGSRKRALSNSSSYVSRLDPGSDRRSIASSQSKPFDQVDFSKAVQQIVPQAVSAVTSTTTSPVSYPGEQAGSLREKAKPVESSPHIVDEGPGSTSHVTEEQGTRSTMSPQSAQLDLDVAQTDLSSVPTQHNGIVAPKAASEPAGNNARSSRLQSTPQQMVKAEASSLQASKSARIAEPSEPPSTGMADTDRGWQNLQTPAQAVFAEEEQSLERSSTSMEHPGQHQSRTGRPRNWSRPKQNLSRQHETTDEGPSITVQPDIPVQPQNQLTGHGDGTREDGLVHRTRPDERSIGHEVATRPDAYHMQRDQPTQSQAQQHWNDQASSVYQDSTLNPSTRQHSPSRQTFAPTEIFESKQLNGRSAMPPLSILDGLKVNKRGKILDEEGDPIGELVEGDLIDCVRQKANAFGQILDDYGRIVGRVTTLGRLGNVRSQSPASTLRTTRAYSIDVRRDSIQRLVSPDPHVSPTLERHSQYVQTEDPRQRAANLQAAASRRENRSFDGHIELDASGYAEAAPLVDHSEIFAPPFIPSRSPKRSPAEPAPRAMDSYFAKSTEQPPPSPSAALSPRLRTWASRNLEDDREEMQGSTQAAPTPAQQISENVDVRTSAGEQPAAGSSAAAPKPEPNPAVQGFITSDQPGEIFPWMINPAPQGTGKWNAAIFNYKDGGVAAEEGEVLQPAPDARNTGVRAHDYASNAIKTGPAAKQYAQKWAPASAGSRKSRRIEHQPRVKSPLSTHNVTSPESNDGNETPRRGSNHTTVSAATDATAGMKKRTYFTHAGRTSLMVPDTEPSWSRPALSALPQKAPSTNESPSGPFDAAVPPDVVRIKGEKRRSRWSMSFGKKAPPVQNLLKKT